MKEFIGLSPSCAKDMGYLQIREIKLMLKNCGNDMHSLNENVFKIEFIEKITTWVNVCRDSK